MEIYIDTASIDEIREAISWGIVSGITTNPSLIKKEVGRRKAPNLDDHIKAILEVAGKRPISLEVTETGLEGMVVEAKEIIRRYGGLGNIVVKIPVNPATNPEEENQYDGLKAIYVLSKEGIAINTTLVMTPEQALLSARAGSAYVSPFAGRIDDYLSDINNERNRKKSDYYPQEGKTTSGGQDLHDNGIVSGVNLVESIVDIFRNYPEIPTQVLAASTRNARQVRELALVGADISTVPFYVLDEMVRHPKTYQGAWQFRKDVVREYADLLKPRGKS